MASIVIDTRELQERLIIWGVDANALIDPETGNPSGVLNQGTIDAVKLIGQKLRIDPSLVYVASVLDGSKAEVGPSEIVTKLLEPPSVLVPEYITQDLDETTLKIANKYPLQAKNTISLLGKRVADNFQKSRDYAVKIAELSKDNKLDQGLIVTYNNWYRSATKLQLLLLKRLNNPITKARFQKELDQAGVDAGVMIAALTKGPLAVAKIASNGKGELGFLWPLVIGAVLFAGLWKSSDVIDAWKGLKEEEANRVILDCSLDPKCDASRLDPYIKQKEQVVNKSFWSWFLGGAAATSLLLLMLQIRGKKEQRATDQTYKLLPVR
jgi:hypothetical protein